MRKKILNIVLVASVMLAGIFSLRFQNALQLSSITNTGYYRIFKHGALIGNVRSLEEIRDAILINFGSKASEDIFFGEGVEVEYSSYEAPVELTPASELIHELDLQVEGLLVEAVGKNKQFSVTSYRDWEAALANVIQFIQAGESKVNYGTSIAGEVRATEDFRFSFQKMPITAVQDKDELEKTLIFSQVFDIKTDVIQAGDTLDSIAVRNGISSEQLIYVNELDPTALLIPGTALNVSPLQYAIDFSYPVIENRTEPIPFEIEYVDDAEKFVGEEEIVQAGVDGQAEAQYLSYVVNGQMVQGERLEYHILTEPIKQIIHKGTKVKPVITNTTSPSSSGSDAPYANIAGFIWPATGICISAEYMDPTYGYGNHYGLDIAGSRGESIWAAAGGTVISAGFDGSFGNQVMIDHHNGIITRYAHMSSIGVNRGEEVSQGKYIGGMGNTGLSFGVHLHFEVHVGGSRLNPRPYLPGGGPRSC